MNEYFEKTYKEALKAYKKNEVPVGAVIVKNNKIIAAGHNNRQSKHSLIGHAEINVILKAERKLNDWRLDDCDLYVTLKPCNMCESIIKESRIRNVFFLLDQPAKENSNIKYIQTNVQNNISNKYEKLIKNFFEKMRQ